MTAASPSPEHLDRRTRDARIRELDRQGVSKTDIARQFKISRPRVTQILATPEPDVNDRLTAREIALNAELAELVRHRETNAVRIRTVRRTLERIAEEREARAIDELLGLS